MTKTQIQETAKQDGMYVKYSGKKRIAYCSFDGAANVVLIQKYANLFEVIGYKGRLSTK